MLMDTYRIHYCATYRNNISFLSYIGVSSTLKSYADYTKRCREIASIPDDTGALKSHLYKMV